MGFRRGTLPQLLFIMLPVEMIMANIPVVSSHNRQVILHVGDRLRLECPIWASNDVMGDIIYQWDIRDLPEYAVTVDTRFRLLESGRIVELTKPVTKSDAGTYQCSGVTGFGQKKVVFEVHIADTKDGLMCIKAYPGATDRSQVLCLMNPNFIPDTIMTIEAEVGSSVEMSCEAIGREPIKYLWFMGNAVANWIPCSQGVLGPNLHIVRIGREHIGQYTCQVKNSIESLNYTYRLIVKEPPSAIPKLIEAVENRTLIEGTSGALVCRVKCSCPEPIIQWLKRIEPEEIDAYKASRRTLVPLPSPRPSEVNELYLALDKLEDASAFMERMVIEPNLAKSAGSARIALAKITIPEREFLYNSSVIGETTERVFVSRLRLRGPVISAVHAGKYVVLTMSRSNLKAIDYDVAYVHILPKSFSSAIYITMVYCVVSIVLILLTGFVSIYCFLGRQNKKVQLSTCRRGAVIFSTAGQDRSLLGVKEYQPITIQAPQSSLFSSGNPISNGRKTYYGPLPYAAHSSSTPSQWNVDPDLAAASGTTSPLMHSNPNCKLQSHLTHLTAQRLPLASTFYVYSGLRSMTNQQPAYWHPPAPSVVLEPSIDQYSAIKESPLPDMETSTMNQKTSFLRRSDQQS